jgi:hypothetical protein
MGELNR